MKRFYKDVVVSENKGILLDGRPVKTPARAALTLPNAALADAVADEWRAQGEEIDPRAMPFTGLANAAIDRVAANPQAFAADLAQYGETELLCYRAESPPELIARQAERWDPLLDWAKAQYDVSFTCVAGIMHQPQPMATLLRLGDAIAAANPFALAALSPIVTIGGSLVQALARGAAVLASDLPLNREINDRVAETLAFFASEDPLDCARQIESLLADMDRRRHLGQQALRYAATYSPAVIAGEHLDFYRRVVAA
jgi:chaperone required for assembly of F1-ATPase